MRREHADNSYRDRPIWRQWPFIPVPVLFVAIIGLWFVDRAVPHESPALLIILNLLLATLPALAIAALFARGFLASGAPGLLLFGCGAVFWSASGLSSLASALDPGLGFNANTTVTIHNVAVWAAALCYLAGAALLERWRAASARRGFHLVCRLWPRLRRVCACHRDGAGAADPGVLRSGRRRQRGATVRPRLDDGRARPHAGFVAAATGASATIAFWTGSSSPSCC